MGVVSRSTTDWTYVSPQNWTDHLPPAIFHHMGCIELLPFLVVLTEGTELSFSQRGIISEFVPIIAGIAQHFPFKEALNEDCHLVTVQFMICTIGIPGI